MPGPIIRRCRYAQKSPPQSPTANRLARCSQSVMVPIGNRSQAICGPIVPVMVTVGTALMEIRENRLYRSEFKTFEEYCQSKWGFNRRNAYQLIEAAGISSEMCAVAHISNGATAEQFVKVFCADHPQVSVCPKRPPQSPTADRLAIGVNLSRRQPETAHRRFMGRCPVS